MKDRLVKFLADVLPDACPFATDVKYKGYQIIYIPPLCKLNPWYEDVMKEKLDRLGY